MEKAPNQQQHTSKNGPNMSQNDSNSRNRWNIDDPFEYAPRKLDRDPWAALLEPLLTADRIQCDAWKDEVQNLLIFAGLFSAVVTTFIVESYKSLQRDPSDDVIRLLSHIAERLDTNNTSALPTLTPFTPTVPSIRINTFWFLSLVLSLTTVLIGIISLQWLREYQNYSHVSPRQQFAICNMRNVGLEKWHVHRIFTTMPLLLQCALILFFAGLIDFLRAFGDLAIVLPVSIMIGFTLLFLFITTVAPTLQGLCIFLYSSTPSEGVSPPAQCPYKSPQSDAVRTMALPLFRLCHFLYPRLRSFGLKTRHFVGRRFSTTVAPAITQEDNFARYIDYTGRTWLSFDLAWLKIRDAYMRRAYKQPLDQDILDFEAGCTLPIFDIVDGMTRRLSNDPSPVYHCFDEICDSVLLPLRNRISGRDQYRQNAYLHHLIAAFLPGNDTCISEFFAVHRWNRWHLIEPTLKHQNLFTFLSLLAIRKRSPILELHRQEVQLRLISHMYQTRYEIRAKDPESCLPISLVLRDFVSDYCRDQDLSEEIYNDVAWQMAQVSLSIFKEISWNTRRARYSSLAHSHYAQRDALHAFMTHFRSFTTDALEWSVWGDSSPSKLNSEVKDAFREAVTFVQEQLEQEISTGLTEPEAQPSLLFYASALFIQEHSQLPLGLDILFDRLYSAVCEYKKLTIDVGRVNTGIEDRLVSGTKVAMNGEVYFSASWWGVFKSRFLKYSQRQKEETPHQHSALPNAVDLSPVDPANSTRQHGPSSAERGDSIIDFSNAVKLNIGGQEAGSDVQYSSRMASLPTDDPLNSDTQLVPAFTNKFPQLFQTSSRSSSIHRHRSI